MAKAKDITELFHRLPRSRHLNTAVLTADQRARIREWITLYLTSPTRPTLSDMAQAMTQDIGIQFTENSLRNRINEAKRDKEKI